MNKNLNLVNKFYKIIATILFLVLISRLAQLQLFNWDKYYSESEKNRIRNVIIDASRGLVLDRNGEILVDNHPTYSVSVIPYEFLKSENTIKLLASILDTSEEKIKRKIKKEKISNFSPVRLKRQIEFKALSDIEENRLDLPGVYYNVESKRFYPSGIKAPHLFGYLGEITSDELISYNSQDRNYRLGDLIGKNGIEISYEDYLKGTAGVKYIEVDVLGREIRELSELSGEKPITGKNVYLTIDATLQSFLEETMSDKQGAAIVLNARNGDVLAFLSKPDYDPEIFSNPLTPELWNGLMNHELKPLYNRACQSLYPPGSTYKLVLAVAGLETGLINLQEKITCKGSFRLGTRTFECWKKGGHGEVALMDAIQQSCNVYFYKKGLDVGLDNWAKYSKMFQFDRKTGIDLPNESAGIVPDTSYFDSKYGKRKWTRGLMLNLAVGQGDLLTTPLQMACFAMMLSNEGIGYTPHFFKRVIDPNTGEMVRYKPNRFQIQGISKATFAIIKEGMYLVVNGPKGTGKASWIKGVEVCGKTGTAQNPHGEDHAWFIGFAPRNNPEIAFCIMVENGGGGGAVAAPIARGVLNRFFSNKIVASTAR